MGQETRHGIIRSAGRMYVDPGFAIKSSLAAVAYDSTTQSAALSADTKTVIVTSTTDCFIAVGSNPTATTSSHFLPGYMPQRIQIPYDGSTAMKIAAVKLATAGNLYITQLG